MVSAWYLVLWTSLLYPQKSIVASLSSDKWSYWKSLLIKVCEKCVRKCRKAAEEWKTHHWFLINVSLNKRAKESEWKREQARERERKREQARERERKREQAKERASERRRVGETDERWLKATRCDRYPTPPLGGSISPQDYRVKGPAVQLRTSSLCTARELMCPGATCV